MKGVENLLIQMPGNLSKPGLFRKQNISLLTNIAFSGLNHARTMKKMDTPNRRLGVEERIDPFYSRLARDIRNSLSRAFVHSLEATTPRPFRRAAAELLARDLRPLHRAYIMDRLEKYERAFASIQDSGFGDELEQAIVIWNEQLFFEVHERLETIWQKTSGEERQAFKGLIKAAAAYVHLEQGNQRAARSLADKAATLLVHHGKPVSGRLDLTNLVKGLEALEATPPKLSME